MSGKRIGYKRVSTYQQNPDSQLMGLKLHKTFTDIETGFSTKNRYALNDLLEYVREDDIVFVECLDRLGRNSYDLDEIVAKLLKKEVEITFVRENITLAKKNDPMSKLAYDMMKAFIHFYSQLTKERQRIGVEKAKKEGRYKGGQTKLTYELNHKLQELMKTRKSKNQIAKELGITRQTLYKYLEKIQNSSI